MQSHAEDKDFGMKKISSSDSYSTYECYVRFDVLMVVTLKITVFRHVTLSSRADSYPSSEEHVDSTFRWKMLFCSEGKGTMFLQNIDKYLSSYTAIHLRKLQVYGTDVRVSPVRIFCYVGYYCVSIILLGGM
jgi:hypothetical protein